MDSSKFSRNKIDSLNLNYAVKLLRNTIGYCEGACVEENMYMAAFLYEMGIYCTFKFGETVVHPNETMVCHVHRNLARHGRIKDDRKVGHCWLDVEGKVLDISIGTWTHHYPKEYRKAYIYGDYSKGFDIDTATSLYDVEYGDDSNQAHCYKPFESIKRAKSIFPDFDLFKSNSTMYEDLNVGNDFLSEVQKYADMYRMIRTRKVSCFETMRNSIESSQIHR